MLIRRVYSPFKALCFFNVRACPGFGEYHNLPAPTVQDTKAYLSATMDVRKQLLENFKFRIGDEHSGIQVTFEHLCRIALEFLHEDTVIAADRQLVNLVRDINLPDETRQLYLTYGDERTIWQ